MKALKTQAEALCSGVFAPARTNGRHPSSRREGSGNPVLDDLDAKLRGSARGPRGRGGRRAVNLMRDGDRSQILVLLGGAAFVGWLLARNTLEITPTVGIRGTDPLGVQ